MQLGHVGCLAHMCTIANWANQETALYFPDLPWKFVHLARSRAERYWQLSMKETLKHLKTWSHPPRSELVSRIKTTKTYINIFFTSQIFVDCAEESRTSVRQNLTTVSKFRCWCSRSVRLVPTSCAMDVLNDNSETHPYSSDLQVDEWEGVMMIVTAIRVSMMDPHNDEHLSNHTPSSSSRCSHSSCVQSSFRGAIILSPSDTRTVWYNMLGWQSDVYGLLWSSRCRITK